MPQELLLKWFDVLSADRGVVTNKLGGMPMKYSCVIIFLQYNNPVLRVKVLVI